MRTPVIILLLLIPFLTLLILTHQAHSQSFVTSLSTTSEFSTLTLGSTTLEELTTSSYGAAYGNIPGVYSAYREPEVCFYVPYEFHVDASAQVIQGTIWGSSPFNFYIMSKPQYDYFVLANPPCGSSYIALKLEYSIRSFTLNWVAPQPGDYYILLENTSMYLIAYSIQLNAIEPATTMVYTTTPLVQTLTFIQQQLNTTISKLQSTNQSQSANPQSSYTMPIAITLVAVSMLFIFLVDRYRRSR